MRVKILFIHNLRHSLIEKAVKPISCALAENGARVYVVHINDIEMKSVDGKMQVFANNKELADVDVVFVRVFGSPFLLAISRFFTTKGIPVVNNPDALSLRPDKLSTQIKLESVGIPTIPTMALLPGVAWTDRLWEQYGDDIVVKPNRGMQGRGVQRFCSLSDLADHAPSQPDDMIWLGQPFIPSDPPGDLRIFVAKKEVVAAMRRIPESGNWIGNLHLGAVGVPHKPSENEKNLAIRAAGVCGLHIAGVDIIEGDEGPLVIEINSNPGIVIGEVTGVDICSAIARTVWAATEE